MSYDKNEIKAGAVILVSTLLLVALVFAVGDFGRFFIGHYYVDGVFDNVQGLPAHAPVIQRGIQIGSVESQSSAEVEGERRVLVRMRIEEGADVLEESVAKITQVGFLNRPFVAILDPVTERRRQPLPKVGDAASDEIPRIRGDSLADFTEIAVKTQSLMDEVMKNTLPKVNDAIESVKALVSSEEFQETSRMVVRDFHAAGTRLKDVMQEVDGMVRDASPKVGRSLSNVETSTARAREVTGDISAMVGRVDRKTGEILEQVSGTVEEARPQVQRALSAVRIEAERLSERVDDVQARLQKLLDDADRAVLHAGALVEDTTGMMRAARVVLEENRGEIRAILVNLERTSLHLESLIRQLDDSPSRLLFDRSVRIRTVPQTIELPEVEAPETER